jgi:hypothetical protein
VALEDVEIENEAGAVEAERHPDEGIACILDHLKLGIDAVLEDKNQAQEVTPSSATDAMLPLHLRPFERRHPKHYFRYLLGRSGSSYKTEHGQRALAGLAWERVVAPPSHAQIVRALLDDVADMLGVPLPPGGEGTCHPLTRCRSGGRLRNVV